MLSIGKLSTGQHSYYLDQAEVRVDAVESVGDGVEEYYVGGTRVEPAEGFVAAAFRHRSSRAGDPQLHTHVLIANLARGPARSERSCSAASRSS